MGTLLFDAIKTASSITDRVLVFYSGGKDSAVTLDLCSRYFKKIDVVFMYLVPGLSFQEAIIRWAEEKYKISVVRMPHFMLSEWLRYGTFRQADLDVPIVSVKDIYNHAREHAGTWWVAAGERIADSIVRRAMIKASGGSIDKKRGRFYPVAHWRRLDILQYIRSHRLKVAPEALRLGFSFRSLMPEDMSILKIHYPRDYQRIKAWFPLVEAGVKRQEYANEEK